MKANELIAEMHTMNLGRGNIRQSDDTLLYKYRLAKNTHAICEEVSMYGVRLRVTRNGNDIVTGAVFTTHKIKSGGALTVLNLLGKMHRTALSNEAAARHELIGH